MALKSIRWRLPLSYAGIALLSVVALGLVLNSIILIYYSQQELGYMRGNAMQISAMTTDLLQAGLPSDKLDNQVKIWSFLLQARVQVLGPDGQVLADSGIPNMKQNLVVSGLLNSGMVVSSVNSAGGARIRTQAGADGTITLPSWGLFLVNPEAAASNQTASPVLSCDKPAPDSGSGKNAITCVETQNPNQQANPSPDQGKNITAKPVPDQGGGTVVQATPVPGKDGYRTPVGVAMQMSGTIFGFNLAPDVSGNSHRSPVQAILSIQDKNGSSTGSIILSDGPAYGQEIESSVLKGWLIASLFAVLLAGGVGFLISRRMTEPLVDLSKVASSMANGDLSTRANVHSSDEFGELSKTFNVMADRVEETVGTLRGFVADAAHQLMTPLTALRTNLELAEEEPDQADRSNYISAARKQLIRMEVMVGELLELSRIEANGFSATLVKFDLRQVVLETAETAASRAEQTGKQFSLDLPENDIALVGDSGRIRHAVDNLLDNAFKYTSADGFIHLSLSTEGDWATIVVEDNGHGIPDEDQPHMFKRFFRGKNSTDIQGSGLGLAIVKAIVDLHGGKIEIKSSDQGTKVELCLPHSQNTE